jgi:phosphopantothenoylcysteine synthetase/decarboxylase
MRKQSARSQGGRVHDDALSVIACGSSGAVALPGYLMYLKNEVDLKLRVLLTHSAERVLPRQTVAWYADEVYSGSDPGLNPTEFALRSLGIVVLPATANMLATAALGLAGTPAQTAVLAAEQPCMFFPSMNASMWGKRVTQQHVASLRDDGHVVVEPQERPGYVIWQRSFAPGPAIPPPELAAELIIGWLDARLARA